MGNWPDVLLAITATMLFRWQGDSWPVTLAKLVGLAVFFLATVALLGIVIVRVF